MNIAVYCSASSELPDAYVEAARALGAWIAAQGHTLVYGGVNAGLMHVIAQAAHDGGGKIIGVVPEAFVHRADPLVGQLVTADDLNDRKAKMYRLADAFVALPGGLGTIDELISTVSQLKVDGDTHRRVHILNTGDLFTPLLTQLRQLAASPLANEAHLHTIVEAQNLQSLIINLSQLS